MHVAFPTPYVKICGFTDLENTIAVAKLGVDYMGLVHHPLSKRYVPLAQLKKLAKIIRLSGSTPVAVFVNATYKEMEKVCAETDIRVVQLHGYMARSQHHLLDKSITRIYVIHIDEAGNQAACDTFAYSQLKKARDFLLYDGLQGGSGQLTDFSKLQVEEGFRYFLSGGLRMENIGAVLQQHPADGIDLSSHVEIRHGIKDVNKIKKILDIVQLSRGAYAV